MNIIRYHSLYPWHTGGSYIDLMKKGDEHILRDVLEFNSFDLYSKEDPIEITEEIKKYYNDLLDKYFNDALRKVNLKFNIGEREGSVFVDNKEENVYLM